MKRKVNSAKKGMVLMMTAAILFIATSIVAVLSTFVIVARNQKIEYEYLSRTKIVLSSKSYELFHKVLLERFVSITNLEAANNGLSVEQSFIDSKEVQFSGIIDVRYEKSPYNDTLSHYIYEFNTSNLVGYNSKELRDMTIITVVDFNNSESLLTSAANYNISETRFA